MKLVPAGLIVLLLVVPLIGCTTLEQPPAAQVGLPTLAVLPSITPEEPVSPMPQRAPTVTPTFTLTPVPVLATATPQPSCEFLAWWGELAPQLVEFFDIVDVAGVTPRASLSGVLLEMRRAYREIERAEYPECAAVLRGQLMTGMEYTVEGFNDFLGDLETAADRKFEIAYVNFWAVANTLNEAQIAFDSRYFSVSNPNQITNSATATWVAEVGEQGLQDRDMTAMAVEFDMLMVTMTAIARP